MLEQMDERDCLAVVQPKLKPIKRTVVVEQVPERALCELQHRWRNQPHANLQRIARDPCLVPPRQRLEVVF